MRERWRWTAIRRSRYEQGTYVKRVLVDMYHSSSNRLRVYWEGIRNAKKAWRTRDLISRKPRKRFIAKRTVNNPIFLTFNQH